MRTSTKDNQLLTLFQEMIKGLENNIPIFPNPVYPFKDMLVSSDDFVKYRDKEVAAIAALKAITINKDNTLALIQKIYEANKKYCEQIANGDPAILALVSITPKKEKTKHEVPGQCGEFLLVERGNDSAKFKWKRPKRGNGGVVKSCQIERTDNDGKNKTIVAISYRNEAEIRDQPRGVEFIYYVVATNTLGRGLQSNPIKIIF